MLEVQHLIDAMESVRVAAFDEGFSAADRRQKPAHYPRMLSAEERAHYAWVNGDHEPQTLLDEVGVHADPDLIEELQNCGIDDLADFKKLQAEHETTQGELQDAESERDGMEEVLSLIAGHLEERDKPLGIRHGKALAQTILGMIETTGRDRFSYAERVRLNEALRHA